MAKFVYSLVLITLVASEAPTAEERKALLDFHNSKRETVRPIAANMLKMVVWATSEELGCAVERCDSIKPDWPKPVFLLACQYKPPGNYIGMKPYMSSLGLRASSSSYLLPHVGNLHLWNEQKFWRRIIK
ncbi:Cysteine-rich secretory protein LCCL domain-containing 1 [Taenia crassiceps]|uniref:Cysteine-rich secretory protein LCCL domain-containing 1 n=1 Tax=Taenia crassiceps TaxID=6207 RepID=A0ABR4QEG2_9CEST